MKNISFSLTTAQFIDGSKDITRRTRWLTLQPGTLLQAIEKGMGLKKGEKVVKLGTIKVVSVRREPLGYITDDDVRREGFPGWTREQFIDMYCRANGGNVAQECTRIEFVRVP